MAEIVVHELHKSFGGARSSASFRAVNVLNGVDLFVEAGEWLAISGPSGCGKSTLLHLLGGLDSPDRGTIVVGGESIVDRSERWRAKFRRHNVGYVFQQYNLIPECDVRGNVELPLLLTRVSKREARRRAMSLLDQFGIADLAAAAPAELSGGEQQRVAIARALIAGPRLILADEPTGALDSVAASLVVDALAAAHAKGQTIVMVTHAADVAGRADRIVHLRDGCVVLGHDAVGVV